jgi:DinB family protein
VNTLTQAERERLTKYLNSAHNEVLRTAEPLSDSQLKFKENPERWSISQIVEHLTIVHSLVLNHIEKLVLQTPASVQSAWNGRDDELLAKIRSRENPVKVPEIGYPKNILGRDELFERFAAIRDRMVHFATTTDAALRSFCFPHPIFGQKDCYQWLLGTGAHCERHLKQIREVMSAERFPNLISTH